MSIGILVVLWGWGLMIAAESGPVTTRVSDQELKASHTWKHTCRYCLISRYSSLGLFVDLLKFCCSVLVINGIEETASGLRIYHLFPWFLNATSDGRLCSLLDATVRKWLQISFNVKTVTREKWGQKKLKCWEKGRKPEDSCGDRHWRRKEDEWGL